MNDVSFVALLVTALEQEKLRETLGIFIDRDGYLHRLWEKYMTYYRRRNPTVIPLILKINKHFILKTKNEASPVPNHQALKWNVMEEAE